MLNFETRVTVGNGTRVAPLRRPRRSYKPRSRRCKTCGESFTPKSKHGEYCSDRCRKKAWRDRAAKQKRSQPQRAKEEMLELLTCPACGKTFFAPAGRNQRHCTPSCRTKAWRIRRETAIGAIAGAIGVSRSKAADLLETSGMKKTTVYLNALGYEYDEYEKVWVKALLASAVAS